MGAGALPVSAPRGARVAAWLALAAVVAGGAAVRIQTTLAQPGFDVARPEKIFKSDPGLIYYVTRRIADAGGAPPADFRADPRVEYPETSDLPAMLTVGQEFLIAWVYLLLGGALPLHVVCVLVMGAVASTAAVGVFGLVLELTRRPVAAAAAAALFALIPGNYRTLGFALVREDLSLPLFALHAWLAARAVRLRTPAAIALAALPLAAALATWHAMSFVVAIEAACVLAWALRTGRSPFAAPGSWIFPAVLAAAALVVPVLRAKLFLVSPPMQIAGALGALAWLERRRPGAGAGLRIAVAAASLAGLAALALGITRAVAGELGDYGHVFELLWAKLRFRGVLPLDPEAVGFGARLLWQGPFATGSLGMLARRLEVGGPLLVAAVLLGLPAWRRGRGDPRAAVLVLFGAAAVAAALLLKRLEILAGLAAPAAGAVLLARLGPRREALAWLALLAVQALLFLGFLARFSTNVWYPPVHQEQMADAVEWIRDQLPPEGAVAADFMNSTAVLAQTGHPIVQQPKYETRRSRERIRLFFEGFYGTSPEAFHALLADELRARYLLLDVGFLWNSRNLGGLRLDALEPAAGTAAWSLFHPDPAIHAAVPGFRLLYSAGEPRPLWLLYEIVPRDAADPAD